MSNENIELETLTFDEPQEIKSITLSADKEGEMSIMFGETEFVFSSIHNQDCCEHVYADFSIMKYHIAELVGEKIESIVVKGVRDMGFVLDFREKYYGGTKVFVPCYNYQNGYYSDDLSLGVKSATSEKVIDLNDYIDHNID